MELLQTIPFIFEGKSCEIRVLNDRAVINVVAFADHHPVNGFRYHIQLPKHAAPERIIGTGALERLIEAAKSDIIEERWKSLQQMFR